jgi:basic amino acid/polyamine antiporter, APA family
VVAVLITLLMLVPGTDISLVWPAEYVILLAWFALGAHLREPPKERDEQALRALLGDQCEEIVAESSEFETGASDWRT